MRENKLFNRLLTPKTSVVLFSILVVATPFIMLQNYLQKALREFSSQTTSIFTLEFPTVLLIVIPIVLFFIVSNIKKLTAIRLYAIAFIFLMLAYGQAVSDYYLNHTFYDLQNNWHYIAYAFFSIIMYRYLIQKNISVQRIMMHIFIRGIAISLFDEGVQVFISNRVFDLSDVAKDSWGLWLGMVAIYFIFENGKILKSDQKILHNTIKEYLKSPFSILVFQGIFTSIYIFVSSNLSLSSNWLSMTSITLGLSIFVFFCIHCFQFKTPRNIMIGVFLSVAIALSISYWKNYDKGIMSINNHLTIYNGIPIPFFDVFIKPNGWFRLVDKKDQISKGDIIRIFEYKPDILIMAVTENNYSGNKFISLDPINNTYFVYNSLTNSGLQIVVLPHQAAIENYNRMVKIGKNVAIIINNE